MQTSLPKDLPRRMRYYQSMIDIDTLMKGSDYVTLKESYVIFLCTKDPFGLNLPVYTFKTACKEAKDFALDDGINKIFFNASAFATEKNLETKGFLGYLCSGKPSDNFTKNLEQRVERLKINEIFRSDYMMDALPLFDARQAGLEEGRLEGAKKKAIETARKMLENKITTDLIIKCTGLSLAEVNKLNQSNS